MKLFIDVAKKKNHFSSSKNDIPIWLMRQAGRYLQEYREIRAQAGSFLNLCYNPELASMVTLQPIKRFDFDAAIIFSDILVVPNILGLKLDFLEGEGPKLEQVTSLDDLKHLKVKQKEDSHEFKMVCEALSLTKEKLEKNKTLIGFAGSPWTVATYMLGRNKHDFDYCRKLCYTNFELVNSTIQLLVEQTKIYLENQIEAGAEAIQLFDSWSGVLTPDLFRKFVIEPNKEIISYLKEKYPHIAYIGFPRSAGVMYEEFAKEVDVDVLSVDYFLPEYYIKNLQNIKIIQGNLDPMILLTNKDNIKNKVQNIIENFGDKDFIFNLGHGILPQTPIDNVQFLVDCIRNGKK